MSKYCVKISKKIVQPFFDCDGWKQVQKLKTKQNKPVSWIKNLLSCFELNVCCMLWYWGKMNVKVTRNTFYVIWNKYLMIFSLLKLSKMRFFVEDSV